MQLSMQLSMQLPHRQTPLVKGVGLGLAILAAFALAAVPGHAAVPNLVTNPGFETGDLTGYSLDDPGGFAGIATGVGHSGDYAIDFGNNPPDATLTQDLSTVAGESYTISYYLLSPDVSGFPAGSIEDHFSSSFGATTLFDADNLPALTPPSGAPFADDFQLYTFTATAQGSTTPLTFGAFNKPSFFILDDLSVTPAIAPAVPEPSPLALLGLGLLPVGLIVRARRRQKAA